MIRSHNQPARFKTEFTNGSNTAVSDTTPDKGGANSGFRPHELLEAALASCMNMSLRMYAEQNGFPLTEVSVAVSLNRSDPGSPLFEYSVTLQGTLSESQKTQLLATLESCPVRRTLSAPLRFRHCDQ